MDRPLAADLPPLLAPGPAKRPPFRWDWWVAIAALALVFFFIF